MSRIKNFIILLSVFVILLELISYFIYKLNILEISYVPKIYMKKNNIPNYEWWTEEKKWGAWHKTNSTTVQKRSCFNVTYKSNSIGARDKNFDANDNNDILLIGDSFAEGYGVNYLDTSQKYIEDLTNLNILNFGISNNFGPVQYYIIFKNLAQNYKHNKILIYFLPANDFGENDYKNWSGSKRYRPYYKKINDNEYKTFIPDNAIKNYYSSTKKIKQKFKNLFWSSGLFININYQYKIYRSKKKDVNEFSAYFESSIDQQKAAIYFIEKIINETNSDVYLVSIPRLQDFNKKKSGSDLKNIYWNKYFVDKNNSNNKFTFIDLINYPPKNLNEIYLECDGHWSPKGNMWAAKIISKFLK
jgi:hypothetical protein